MNIFFIFFLLSLSILIISKLSQTYTKTFVFPIKKVHIPKDKIILNKSNTLEISMKSSGFKLLPYYLKQQEVLIDFSSHIYINDTAFIWTKTKGFSNLHKQFNKQIEIVNIFPDSLFFNFDSNCVKNVPVKLNQNVQFSAGYNSMQEFFIKPDSVQIIGPEHLVSKIHEIQTDTLKLVDVNKDFSEKLSLKLPESEKLINISAKQIQVSAKVEKFSEGILEIPIQITNKPGDLNLNFFPKTASVSFYTSLKNYNTIQVANFKVICDYNKIKDNTNFMFPELIKQPKAVKRVKLLTNKIDFIILK